MARTRTEAERILRKVHPQASLVDGSLYQLPETIHTRAQSLHDRYNTATTFTRAAEEGLVDLEKSFHVGPRGPVMSVEVFDHTRENGYNLIHGKQLFARGLKETADDLKSQLGDIPVYLCFDMDFFDPSCAPGVCTPTWGGASAREGLEFLQAGSLREFFPETFNVDVRIREDIHHKGHKGTQRKKVLVKRIQRRE